MTVDAVQANIQARARATRRVRHALAGGDVLRDPETAAEYIPTLLDQTPIEYRQYIERPVFFEATSRTQTAMSGLVFTKSATVELPDAALAFVGDVDAYGTSADEFAARIVDELQATPIGCIVVSHNGNPDSPGTADAPSGRPTLRYVPAEQILGYGHEMANGQRRLAQLRIREHFTAPGATEFATVDIDQIRVLDIETTGGVRAYRERVFREQKNDKNQTEWTEISRAYPLNNGRHVDYVPAVLVSADGRGEPCAPPLAALAEMNLSHWRTSADYEHALHFCGLPTPYVVGAEVPTMRQSDVIAALNSDNADIRREVLRPQGAPSIKLGSARAIVFSNPAADMRYLTLPTEGLGALDRALERKEAGMAVLGARMLAREGAGVESAEALAIKRSGETSALVRLANAVSAAMSQALGMLSEWAGGPREASYKINTEFASANLDPAMVGALLGAVNAGKMSLETFIFNMRRGGFVPDDRTDADERELIDSGPQPAPTFGGF